MARNFRRAVAAIIAGIALSALASGPGAGEIAGPPLYTSAGCRADQPFTVEYVAKVLDVPKSVVLRMLKRYGLHPWQVCALDARRIAPLVAATRMNKFGYDEPDEAMKHRRRSYLDESGTIRPNGLLRAARQRQQNAEAHRQKTVTQKTVTQKAAGVNPGSWISLGPFNVGGRVRAIAPHPTIPNRILLGSVAGGIFRSVDGGATWVSVNDYLPSVAITSIVHDPSNPSVVYASTGEGFFNIDAVRGIGVLKSTDAGDTWAAMPGTDPSLSPAWYYVNRIAVDPSNSLVLLAATRTGLMRSSDGGASWSQVTSANAGDVKFNHDGTRAMSGEYGGISYSIDHGLTWNFVSLGGGRAELAYSASTGNWFVQLDLGGGQVLKSTTGGVSWVLLSTPGVLGIQGWYDNAIWVDPTNENRVIVGGSSNGVKMSVDGGTTFLAIGAGVHADYHALVHDPGYASNGIVYVGNDGGIYKFTGVNAVATPQFSPSDPPFVNLNNLSITQFYGGAGGTVPMTRIVGGTQDNGSLAWQESSGTWTQIAASDGGKNQVQQTDNRYLYGEFQWLAVYRSTNGGIDTFGVEMICAGLLDSDCSGGSRNTNFIAPMALDPSNPNRLYAGGASLWRSDNVRDPTAGNVGWTRIKSPAGPSLNAIAVAPSNPNVVWVGDNNGGLYRSIDATSAAPAWTPSLSPLPGRQVMRIVIDPYDAAHVYVTFGGYASGNVRMTTNGLDPAPVWQDRSGTLPNGLPDAPVRALVAHPMNADWIYAGTEVGMFASQDGGLSWATTNDGPGTVSVEELFFLDATRIVASTHGRGMYMASVTPPPQAHGTLQFASYAQTVVEGQSSTLQVTRVGGSSGVVGVTVTSANGSASAGGDFTAVNQVLTWADGDTTSRTVTIQTLPDAVVEGNETFTLSLSAPTGGATLGNPALATITIAEPDVFPQGCTMPPGWTTPAGANAGWSVDTSVGFEGRCALRSNPIGNFQRASVQYTDTFPAGNITFNARTDSEPRVDCLHVYIDGAEQNTGTNCLFGGSPGNLGLVASSGTDTGWRSFGFPVAAGTHTILFVYYKANSNGTGGADAAWIDNFAFVASTVPTLTGVVSRKSHGAAGYFDLPIDTAQPINGAVSVESRAIGSGHKVVFQFSAAPSSPGTPSCVDANGAPVGSAFAAIVGNTVEVTLTGIPDAKRVTVSLSNVNGSGFNTSASVGFLLGDGNLSRAVTANDILRVKGLAASGAPAPSNFRLAVDLSSFPFDVDLSGSVDANDVAVVKQAAGGTL